MNQKVLHTLEYDKIIESLIERATSGPGKSMCKKLKPMTDLEEITKAQQETEDALSRLFRKGSISFGNNRDLRFAVKSLTIGSSLSAVELLHIAGMLENVSRIKAYSKSERDDIIPDSLDTYFSELEPLTSLANEIRRCILSETEIADDASPKLKSIRRNISITNDRVHSHLQSMINGSARTFLQDAVITMRNNRYCIPVKAEHKGQVPGMVHDQSSTGSTFFIEPAAVVSLNNELRELELQEQEEITVILATLSAAAGEHTEALLQNQKLMTLLDFIFAKAGLAMDMKATRPVFNTEHHLKIRSGRHPLIDPAKVVPIDVELGENFDLLIVTGPNTGGKTVSLKTVGLFTLMGQAGLHIPALDRSELSVFEEVYADIGDEQSIEQSLSTFSSHMKSIVYILKHANENSLCLFDELGAGTDPTEGAALAISILDHLHTSGIRAMATTHYSELKVYALSTDFVQNACCEFDVTTLRPTYRLLIGIPGKSNAFAISSKLGLPKFIIEEAKKHITEDKESFEDVIAGLEKSRISMEKEQRAIESYKQEIKTLQQQLQTKTDKIDASREKILKEANEEARRILQEAKNVADETIRVFQQAGPGASIKDLEKSRDKVRGKISEKNASLSIKAEAPTHKLLKPDQLKLGDSVKVISLGMKGYVRSLPDKSGKLFVQCGLIRSQVDLSDLVLVEEDTTTGKPLKGPSASRSHSKMSKALHISPEINLLGLTVDEALMALDKYLDDAFLAHLPSVRIVHGKGTGALRNAVQSHLKRSKYVKTFRLGEYGEGDSGVTIAEFK